MADTDSTPGLVLTDVLTCCTAAITAAGLTAPTEPGVVHTQPVIRWAAADCSDALAVWQDRIVARPLGENVPSSPGDRQLAGWHSVALIRVQLWRCHPIFGDQGGVPDTSPETLRLLRAAWACWVELGARAQAATLFPSVPITTGGITRKDIGIGSMTPLPPQGVAAGWQINLEVGLPAVLG